MEKENIKYQDFKTDISVIASMSKTYTPFADYSGFMKSGREIVLFNYQDLDMYLNNFDAIKIYALTKEEYIDFKSRNIKHNLIKVKSTILNFDENFFNLNGKSHNKIRRYKNYYSKMDNLTIQNELNSYNDIVKFVSQWKQLRKHAHFQLFIGYELNFFKKYYSKLKDRLICRFFYIGKELVGYTVLERINNNLYNLVHRKSNTNYQNLCLYIDYYSFQTIFNEIQEPFYVNMGSDIGESGMSNYKANTFKVESIIYDLYDIKIKKV
jgi:hypothetical protein